MSENDTTTIQVSYEVAAALDRRKSGDDTYDSVIRKLINNSPVSMGKLREADQPIEVVGNERLENAPGGATCTHYDVVTGETCGEPAKWLQTIKYGDGEPSELYLCDEHGPETEK
jgi:predicted CopG family antitoxin